jgi:hypothetical protein
MDATSAGSCVIDGEERDEEKRDDQCGESDHSHSDRRTPRSSPPGRAIQEAATTVAKSQAPKARQTPMAPAITPLLGQPQEVRITSST